MRAVIQRVKQASVEILPENGTGEIRMRSPETALMRSIEKGLVVLLGIEEADESKDVDWLVQKIINLRIFADQHDLMNLSVMDVEGDMLVISQFTLFASTRKGNRPSFTRSAKPDHAIPLYEEFVKKLQQLLGKNIKTGEFGAHMQVHLINDGPVTIMIDTKNRE
ncbi:MAG: D-tyrosyl-tRNA(Tyr) deacylase [Chitinophagales bacterium]|nr:D-tyrosyl-tRNA(Tyr) deacylase [Chitinophagales bacterium]